MDNKLDEREMVGVNLLVTLLLRYPAAATVGIIAEKEQLRLSFLVTDRDDQRSSLLEQRLLDTLAAYFAIEDREPIVMEVRCERHEGLGVIEVLRDLETLEHGEISLIVELMTEVYGGDLICEPVEAPLELEDFDIQEEWIGLLLENLRRSEDQRSLLALREGGRVLVYNT
jgi:hypothetical protein